MTEAYIKKLDDSELIDELNQKQEILDLCVHGVVNSEYAITPDGLHWIKDDLYFLTKELQERFVANDRRGEASNNNMPDLSTDDALEVFFEGLRVLRRTGRRERANAYLDRFLDVLLEKKAESD